MRHRILHFQLKIKNFICVQVVQPKRKKNKKKDSKNKKKGKKNKKKKSKRDKYDIEDDAAFDDLEVKSEIDEPIQNNSERLEKYQQLKPSTLDAIPQNVKGVEEKNLNPKP